MIVDNDCTSSINQEEDWEEDNYTELPRLVVALSLRQPLIPGMRICMVSADEVIVGRGADRRIVRRGKRVAVTVDDSSMSREQLLLRPQPSGWELQDLGSKNGTIINAERKAQATLTDGDVIEVGSTVLVFREAGLKGRPRGALDCRDRDLAHEDHGQPMAFRTTAVGFEQQLASITQIAKTQVPVLLRGETGSGKDVVARTVHELSGRRGPFVAVNCGALPRNLVESEFFGYKRGSFSDAREDREGLMRRAQGGTVFLDEIAELPSESQVALLRVLQDGELRPIGANDTVSIDVRVIAATNQDLERRIAAGQFRPDLYARIAGFELKLLPLRERREDLGTLIAAILGKLGSDASRVTLHRQAARALFFHTYPMNVRELEQAIRAAVAFAEGGQIRLEHLPEVIREQRVVNAVGTKPEDPMLRERLHAILFETRGNVTAAARALNKAPVQIRRWCRRYAIDLSTFRD